MTFFRTVHVFSFLLLFLGYHINVLYNTIRYLFATVSAFVQEWVQIVVNIT